MNARPVTVGDRVVTTNGQDVRPAETDEDAIGTALEVLDDPIIGRVVHVGMYSFVTSFLDSTNPISQRPLARFEEERVRDLLAASPIRERYR